MCVNNNLPDIDLVKMAQAQQDDVQVQAYRTTINKLVLEDLPILVTNLPTYKLVAITYGLTHDSILNSSLFFHMTNGLPPDCMYDILEGCLQYEVKISGRAEVHQARAEVHQARGSQPMNRTLPICSK